MVKQILEVPDTLFPLLMGELTGEEVFNGPKSEMPEVRNRDV